MMNVVSQSFELPLPPGEVPVEGCVRVAPHPNLLQEGEGIRGAGWRRYIKVFLVFLFFPPALHAAEAPRWQVLPDKSSIEWTATYGDKPVKGVFTDFLGDIVFDPQHPDLGQVTVKIEMAKVKSSDKDAQANLPNGDWFAATTYPLATFIAKSFTHPGGNNYIATGTLTIRGKEVPVTLPFTTQFYDDTEGKTPVHYARVDGETTLKRLDFGIGQGDWADTSTIGNDVQISIHLVATQAP